MSVLFGAAPLHHAVVGVYAVRASTGEVLADQNSDLSLIPASCMKIATTGAALEILGPDFRFETRLEYDGTLDSGGELQGNLYIRGGGDPCLGSGRSSNCMSWREQILAWADAVEQAGIRSIQGDVIGDANHWESALAVPSWQWEDLGNYYGAGACALSFHENCYSIFLEPGKEVGDGAHLVRTEPPLPLCDFCNELKTGTPDSGDQACIYGSEFGFSKMLRGTIPLGVKEFSIKGALLDPSNYAASLLKQELERRGIAILSNVFPKQSITTNLHTTFSPPLQEIVYWTNQKSINLYAEHLLKMMGEKQFGEGSTKRGIQAVTEYWKSQGIDLDGFHLADGSGLSRKNLITAKQLVAILKELRSSSIFVSSLPEKMAGIRGKTGGMSFIKGFAGYADDVIFAILVNQSLDPSATNEWIKQTLRECF